MAIVDELLNREKPDKPSWIKDLIQSRYTPQEERKKRKPIGFDFKRDPFDPSSYYRQLGSFRDISRGANAVTQQEVANREEAEREKAWQEAQNAMRGISPKLTYGGGQGPPSSSSGGGWTSGKFKYRLGPVSSNTAGAAQFFGNKYGIRTVGGYRANGGVPGSDHPKGRALDYMTNNIRNGKAVGDALANDLLRNAKRWNVKYIIWNRYIWSPSRGWRRYSGSNPHTDHVHASFNT